MIIFYYRELRLRPKYKESRTSVCVWECVCSDREAGVFKLHSYSAELGWASTSPLGDVAAASISVLSDLQEYGLLRCRGWKSVWKRGVAKYYVEGNAIGRNGCSSRLDSVAEAAIAGNSCRVMLVQVRLEEVRLGKCGEM